MIDTIIDRVMSSPGTFFGTLAAVGAVGYFLLHQKWIYVPLLWLGCGVFALGAVGLVFEGDMMMALFGAGMSAVSGFFAWRSMMAPPSNPDAPDPEQAGEAAADLMSDDGPDL